MSTSAVQRRAVLLSHYRLNLRNAVDAIATSAAARRRAARDLQQSISTGDARALALDRATYRSSRRSTEIPLCHVRQEISGARSLVADLTEISREDKTALGLCRSRFGAEIDFMTDESAARIAETLVSGLAPETPRSVLCELSDWLSKRFNALGVAGDEDARRVLANLDRRALTAELRHLEAALADAESVEAETVRELDGEDNLLRVSLAVLREKSEIGGSVLMTREG